MFLCSTTPGNCAVELGCSTDCSSRLLSDVYLQSVGCLLPVQRIVVSKRLLTCVSDFEICLGVVAFRERERGRGDGIKRCCKERRKRFEEKEMPIRRDVKRSKVQ